MKKLKRALSLFLAVLMSIGILSGFSANVFAAERMTIYMVELPRGNDPNKSGWGHPVLNFMGGWSTKAGNIQSVLAANSYTGKAVYCIEPGIGIHTGDTMNGFGESFWDSYPSNLNGTIPPYIIKPFIGRIMQYGWQGNANPNWDTRNPADAEEIADYTATQLLIWETIVGERDSQFNKVNANAQGKNNIKEYIQSDHPLYNQIFSSYTSIENKVKQHVMLPSFFNRSAGSADTYELKWNGKKYSVTLTDSNNVLNNFNFSSNTASLKFTVSGNQLTITCDTAPKTDISITAEKKNGQRTGVIVWSDGNIGGGIQDTATYGAQVTDPIIGFLKLEIMTGNMKLVKTSEDGKVEGIQFAITGDGYSATKTTNSAGEIEITDLNPGIYTITEQSYDKYEPQETRRVTIVSGQTATVTFNNTLRRGNLKVTKTSEDGLAEGIQFRLSGNSLSGLPVEEFAITNSLGVAEFKDVLIGSGYELSEVNTDIKYVVPENQTAAVEWNKVTEKSFHNILKKFRVTVTKSDSETGTAQGNASLAGATYGIYKGNTLVDSYSTNSDGSFTTNYYVCDDDWFIREINPSEGYLLDNTIYHVGAEPKLYTVELNTTANDVIEHVKKGSIAIIKHTDDGSTQIETPEVGAEFAVFLKSAGSYDNAKETERDYLTCDENGFAKTKDLPYGAYTVEQAKGWEGNELIPAFDVFISDDGQVYRYLINNATFESYIKIIKVDAETGKTIPYAGAGFQLYRPDGSLITQSFAYPSPVTIDTFYTAADGTLITPEPLEYGKGYSLVEREAPYGYVLDSTPIYFDVTADHAAEEGTLTVVRVERPNMAQKGVIKISKSGEVFSTVTESNGIYQPVYSEERLAGAVYEIYANADIITPDGTTRAKKDDLVATIETGPDGAVSDPLYLGSYRILEKKAPYGMTLNTEPIFVELVYAGQEVEFTETSARFYNERQRVEISLGKLLEQDNKFGIGMNGEIKSVSFGLYAAEALAATDGTIIPKDGLLEIACCDENGKAIYRTDVPVGAKLYIKEYSTDAHYQINDKQYPIIFEYEGQDVTLVQISANDGVPIENELIRGNIIGKKIDEDGFTIAGALFGLFRNNETEFSEDTAILTAKSNEIGVFGFENIPYGNWVVREIQPAPAFALNETSYPVTISKNQQVVEIEIENRFITGSVQTTKVDAQYPDQKLTGAVFEIYVDVDGNKEFDAEIDKLIGEMTETETGVYGMDGLRYNGYFLYEKTAPVGYVKDNEYYYFEISNDGETVIVENKAGVGFINMPTTGELELTKKDVSDGKLLAGVGFRIRNAQGEIVAEGYTNEYGVARFHLRCGIYTYQEFDPLDNYLLDDTAYPFEIKENDEIVKAVMTNEKKPETDIPQTGDNSNMLLWLSLAAASGFVLIIVGTKKFRRNKNKKQS